MTWTLYTKMSFRLWKFEVGGSLKAIYFAKNQDTQRKEMTVYKKVTKSHYQSEFSTSKIIRIFLIFFNYESYFNSLGPHYFLLTSIFDIIYFLKTRPIFELTVTKYYIQ
jgi:hypothetical protein